MRHLVNPITVAQLISIGLIAVGVYGMIRLWPARAGGAEPAAPPGRGKSKRAARRQARA